jgi:hypothetical protein
VAGRATAAHLRRAGVHAGAARAQRLRGGEKPSPSRSDSRPATFLPALRFMRQGGNRSMAAPRSFLSGLLEKSAGITLAAALTAGLLGITPVVNAQQAAPQGAPAVANPAQTAPKSEMDTFRHYLRRHPSAARALRKDPSLVNNPDFLAKHTGVQKFLAHHPTVQEELKQNPTAFLPLKTPAHKQTAKR